MAGTRSPNYPAVSLPEAIDVVRKLHKSEGRSLMDPTVVARAMGYGTLHGAARSRLAALRKYGLIDDLPGGFKVSELARVIMFPPSADELTEALRDAAMRPELFRDLASQVGASDQNLLGRLMRLGFTETGAAIALASYRQTFSLVEDEASDFASAESEDRTTLDSLPRRSESGRVAAPSNTPPSAQTISLPLGPDVWAEIRIFGAAITAKRLETVGTLLAAVKENFGTSDVELGSSPEPTPDRRLIPFSPDPSKDVRTAD